jgi:hypothetical protein
MCRENGPKARLGMLEHFAIAAGFPNNAMGWLPASEAWLQITGKRHGEVETAARSSLLHNSDDGDDRKPPMIASD